MALPSSNSNSNLNNHLPFGSFLPPPPPPLINHAVLLKSNQPRNNSLLLSNHNNLPLDINTIKAIPSPSPLVTPEMGERLCRMASQHYLSDYNRYKRSVNPHQQQQQQQIPKHSPAIPSTHPQSTINHQALPKPSLHPQAQPQLQIPLAPILNPQSHLSDSTPVIFSASSIPESPSAPPLASISLDTCPQPSVHTAQDSENVFPPAQPIGLAIDTPPLAGLHSAIGAALPPTNGPHHLSEGMSKGAHPGAIKTSETHPMNISPVVPPELTGALAVMLRCAPSRPHAARLPVDLYELTGVESERAYELFWKYYEGRVAGGALAPGRLGNLLLSSCPGKKVRMHESAVQRAAAGSRSPICRDLRADLTRAQQMGVRAIICCLDDEELGFLGSPWKEYERVAAECGLAVVRIPMAEGYAPQKGIDEIDNVLERVIRRWTALGADVLCHCRGGVGRAGLVACCWMLRIGLVNKPSFVKEDAPRDVKEVMSMVDGTQLVPKNSVLGQVEKVIEVIRRRRSVKAIETPQQVHFIMQYANWLDSQTEHYQ